MGGLPNKAVGGIPLGDELGRTTFSRLALWLSNVTNRNCSSAGVISVDKILGEAK
jgi:hypothetical protein